MISLRNRRFSLFALLFLISCLMPRALFANEKTNDGHQSNNARSIALKPGSNLTISGMVKVDFIYDLAAPSGDRINYTTISTDDSKPSGQSRIHARESRIGIKYKNEIYGKELTAIIEGDFYGGGTDSPSGSEKISNAVNFRLRHAYLSYDHWTFGQTWSNYVDVKSFPETLDFSNETGQAFIRQAQVRYQHEIDNFILSYSLENPETDVFVLEELFEDGTDFQTIDPFVDITVKAKYQSQWGHVSLQAVARKMKVYIDTNGLSETGFGVGASGKIHLTANDTLRFHFSQGDGIGRYIQEVAGLAGLVTKSPAEVTKENDSFTLLNAKGGYLGYQHRLSKIFRLNINSGFIDINYSSMANHFLLANRTKKLTSFHSNFIWSVLPNLEIGLEHSVAKLTTLAGNEGTIKRLQLSTKFRF